MNLVRVCLVNVGRLHGHWTITTQLNFWNTSCAVCTIHGRTPILYILDSESKYITDLDSRYDDASTMRSYVLDHTFYRPGGMNLKPPSFDFRLESPKAAAEGGEGWILQRTNDCAIVTSFSTSTVSRRTSTSSDSHGEGSQSEYVAVWLGRTTATGTAGCLLRSTLSSQQIGQQGRETPIACCRERSAV